MTARADYFEYMDCKIYFCDWKCLNCSEEERNKCYMIARIGKRTMLYSEGE